MMRIFIMRHAESESGEREDPTRALTDGGRAQIRTMAAFMQREAGRVDCCFSSYFKRAADTAAPMAETLGAGAVVHLWQLQPDGDPKEAWQAIQRHGHGDVLVVTHHPLTNELIELLTGAKTDDVSFHHAHIVKIEPATDKHMGWKLHWLVGPKLVERDEAVTEAAIALADAVLESLPLRESVARRAEALEKPYKRAEKAIKRHWKRQRDAMVYAVPLVTVPPALREAGAGLDDIDASLRAAVSNLPLDSLIADLFDEALSDALSAAAEHVASDFAYSDETLFDTFEARYLADKGFARITGGVDDTTIAQVARAVANAYQDGANYQGIVDTIKHTFADFNDYRLNLIAQTELNNAYNAGLMEMGKLAGADLKSSVTTTDHPCPSCVTDEAAGSIPIDAPFPSGFQMPTFHPMCGCSLELHAGGAD
jgi:phosphohistidine phosphatase